MSERFSDEVLQRARQAYQPAYARAVFSEPTTTPTSVSERAGLAAMRAVLEGHLADRCDNELTRKVDGKMTDYVCGLPRDHEGSCLWRQVASGGSPR